MDKDSDLYILLFSTVIFIYWHQNVTQQSVSIQYISIHSKYNQLLLYVFRRYLDHYLECGGRFGSTQVSNQFNTAINYLKV